jgi:hypothetical protein
MSATGVAIRCAATTSRRIHRAVPHRPSIDVCQRHRPDRVRQGSLRSADPARDITDLLAVGDRTTAGGMKRREYPGSAGARRRMILESRLTVFSVCGSVGRLMVRAAIGSRGVRYASRSVDRH